MTAPGREGSGSEIRKHYIQILVENRFGVLSRVAGLFSARGFNIDSLSVAPGIDPSVSQMTIETQGDDHVMEQIIKQLNKLIDVIKVVDLTEFSFLCRETILIRVNTTTRPGDREEAFRIVEIFRSKIVDSSPTTYTIEVTGDEDKIEAILNFLKPLGIKDVIRSGKVAIAREDQRSAGKSTKPAIEGELSYPRS
jgi:acetolactate synthase-1/3 small subunit